MLLVTWHGSITTIGFDFGVSLWRGCTGLHLPTPKKPQVPSLVPAAAFAHPWHPPAHPTAPQHMLEVFPWVPVPLGGRDLWLLLWAATHCPLSWEWVKWSSKSRVMQHPCQALDVALRPKYFQHYGDFAVAKGVSVRFCDFLFHSGILWTALEHTGWKKGFV